MLYAITVSVAAPQDIKNKCFPNWNMPYSEAVRYLHRLNQADQMWVHILPVI